jgi:hypothetical protein
MHYAVNTILEEEVFPMWLSYIHCWATDVFSRQKERPTTTSLQLSDSNKDLVLSPTGGRFIPKKIGRLTVGRNITLTLTWSNQRGQ